MSKKMIVFLQTDVESFAKSHVDGYTRKDGVRVAAHERRTSKKDSVRKRAEANKRSVVLPDSLNVGNGVDLPEKIANVVKERVEAMINDHAFQKILIKKRAAGASDNDLHEFVTHAAIATLYGKD